MKFRGKRCTAEDTQRTRETSELRRNNGTSICYSDCALCDYVTRQIYLPHYRDEQQSEQQQAETSTFGNEACNRRKAGRPTSDSADTRERRETNAKKAYIFESKYHTRDSLADLTRNSDMSYCQEINSTFLKNWEPCMLIKVEIFDQNIFIEPKFLMFCKYVLGKT